MTNENVKTQVINDVIVAMSAYIAADLIQILERVIVDKTIDVVMERINTLPAEIKDSVDQQNEYIIKLFLYKKKIIKPGKTNPIIENKVKAPVIIENNNDKTSIPMNI